MRRLYLISIMILLIFSGLSQAEMQFGAKTIVDFASASKSGSGSDLILEFIK